MTITNGYCTLAEIKARKEITSTNATDDGFIEKLVEAASRFIDSTTGRRFYANSVDETRYYTAEDTETLWTDDIVSVTTLATDDDASHAWGTTWTTNDYDLMPHNAAMNGQPYNCIEATGYNGYGFPMVKKGVKVVGKFGYASTTPSDINVACQLIVVTMYKNRFGQNMNGPATVTAAGLVITPADVPASAEKLIRPYTRRL